ncbi:MAG TPA: hypothetical protein VGX23_32870, partial [Actinocrinis sp.]|nr:hypothetical protein [Actinocrinis sp.]
TLLTQVSYLHYKPFIHGSTLRPQPRPPDPNANSHTHQSDPAKTAKLEVVFDVHFIGDVVGDMVTRITNSAVDEQVQ